MYSEEQYFKALEVYEKTKSVTKTITDKLAEERESGVCQESRTVDHAGGLA